MSAHLSPKENLLRVLRRTDPEYVPVRRMNGLIPGMVRLHLNGDLIFHEEVDRWGVRFAGGGPPGAEWEPRVQAYAVGHPLSDLSILERYPFPNPDEPGLCAGMFDAVDRANNLVFVEIGVLPFTRAHFLLGMEALFMAMADQPETVGRLLHLIADYQIAVIHRVAAQGVDGIRGEDDYGSQNSLMISPSMWRRLVKPELARIVGAAKGAGLLFCMHSCGHIMQIVPDLIAIGVDILDPIQQQANDQAELKRLYGDRLCFKDGLSTQGALTQGTPAEVAADVRERIRVLAPGGGYILGPDNSIAIPEANYRAYLAAGQRFGRYPIRID